MPPAGQGCQPKALKASPCLCCDHGPGQCTGVPLGVGIRELQRVKACRQNDKVWEWSLGWCSSNGLETCEEQS